MRLPSAQVFLWIALLAALFVTGLRLFGIDEAGLLTLYAKDDSFYYFHIARHLARGNGPTFDGLDWTNGMQPLWCLILVPIYWFVEDGSLGARLGCLFSLVLALGGFFLLARVLARVVGPWPAALAFAGTVFAAPVRVLAASGMDWSMNVFMQALVVWAFVRLGPRPAERSKGALFLVGLCVGALCIQRPDTGLLTVLLCLGVLRTPGGLSSVLWIGAGASLVALPYLIGSYFVFGTALPVSGEIKLHMAERALANADNPARARAAWNGTQVFLWPLGGLFFGHGLFGGPVPGGRVAGVLLALLVPLVGWAAVRRDGHAVREREGRVGIVFPLLVAAVLHTAIVAHKLGPWAAQYGDWYFAPQVLAGMTIAALGLWALGHAASSAGEAPARARVLGVAACVLLLAGLARNATAEWTDQPRREREPEALAPKVAEWVQRRLPGARIGAFNAGRLGYYIDGELVNLDGLVNTHAYAHRVMMSEAPRFDLLGYLIEHRVEYLLEVWPASFENKVPEHRFDAQVGALFEMTKAWRTFQSYDGERPGSYQLYRLDLEAADAILAGGTD